MRTLNIKAFIIAVHALSLSALIANAQVTYSLSEVRAVAPPAGAVDGSISFPETAGFDLVGGGADTWDAEDNLSFYHGTMATDFDLRVRVQSLQQASTWTKAGIMARESLSGDSRCIVIRVTPTGGANDVMLGYRTWLRDSAGVNGGNHEDRSSGNFTYSAYPWIRLVRAGSVFTSYASRDGVTWEQSAQQDTATWALDYSVPPADAAKGPLNASLEVGLSCSSHDAPLTALAEFRDYGAPTDPVQISRNPADLTLTAIGMQTPSGEMSVGVAGGYDFVDLQWYKNGTLLPGETKPVLKFVNVTSADSGSTYFVTVSNRFNATTATTEASAATLIVEADITPPTLLSAESKGAPHWVVLKFSEAINPDPATSLNPYNFYVDNNLGTPEVAFMGLTPDTVVLRFPDNATPIEGTTYTITVDNVQDLAVPPNAQMAGTAQFTVLGDLAYPKMRVHIYKWTSINNMDTLVGGASYPDNPDLQYGVASAGTASAFWEDPTPSDDLAVNNNFTLRLFGIYNCPKTGDYQFYTSSDDGSRLYLSTDESMANKRLIAFEPAWNGARDYTGTGNRDFINPENRSPLIRLEGGRQYYMEQIMAEGGGGNNASVAVRPPGGDPPTLPISERSFTPTRYMPGTHYFFSTFGAGLVQVPPTNQTVTDSQQALFTCVPDGTPPYAIQWFQDGAPISGATGRFYRTPATVLSMNQAKFRVCVSNEFGGACSAEATLTVQADTTGPAVVSAQDSPDGTVLALFSEPVTSATANVAANYSLQTAGDAAIVPSSATLLDDNVTVKLVATLKPATTYTLTVSNVKDVSAAGNGVNPSANTATFATFLVGVPGNMPREWWYNNTQGFTDFTHNAAVENGIPDFVDFVSTFNSPQTSPDTENYGDTMTGFIIPSVTGDYRFQWHSDDSGYFAMSTDANPANVRRIVEERGCCNYIESSEWVTTVHLIAGKAYYAKTIFKEGGGGDYAELRWKLASDANYNFIPSANIYGGARLDSFTQPVNVATGAGEPATFSFAANGLLIPALTRQWFSNDVAIPDANGWSFTLPYAQLSADQAKFHVELLIPGMSVWRSADATLTVTAATTPTVAAIACGMNADTITFIFNKPLDNTAGAVADVNNYSVGGVGLVAGSGIVSADGASVTFQTDRYAFDTDYPVAVFGLTDFANLTLSYDATWHSCVPEQGWVKYEVYSGITGTLVTDLTGNAKYPNSPDLKGYITTFDSRQYYPDDSHENYGARMRAFFTPPADGNYTFFVHSDDASTLWLGTSSDFSTLAQIAVEPTCCKGWDDAAVRSTPIALVGGQPYAIQYIYKEGGGGDIGQVAYTTDGSNPGGPMSGQYLSTIVDPLVNVNFHFTQQPVNATVCYGTSAHFETAATLSAPYTPVYTWQKSMDDGLTWTDVATGATYDTPVLVDTDSGLVRVVAKVPGASIVSDNATLTVSTAATALGALPTFNPVKQSSLIQVGVLYSRAMSDDAINPLMYTMTGGVNITGAIWDDAAHTTVNLEVTMTPNTAYTLTIDPAVKCENGDPLCGNRTFNFRTPDGLAGIDFAQPVSLQGGRIVNGGVAPGPYTKDGVLHMTDAVNSQQGGFYWDPFGPDALIKGFLLSFNLRIGDGTCCSGRFADGMSMSFGNASSFGAFGSFPSEEGTGNGIIVSFDTWDNNGTDTAPALDIKAGSNADPPVASQSFVGTREGGRAYAGELYIDPATDQPMTMWTGANFTEFKMQLLKDGTMNVWYKDAPILQNVQTGYVPTKGASFLFAARTGGANEVAWIKDLVIKEIYLESANVAIAQDANDASIVIVSWTLPEGATAPQLLQSDDLVTWTVVDGATTSPWSITKGAKKFYRLQYTGAQ